MKKLQENGKVAVVYSPGFGAGWYTWNQENPELLFDPDIVKMVEREEWDKLKTYMHLKFPDAYLGGLEDLQVEWIKEGTAFRIHEYDGNESIEIKEDMDWFIA